jgi:hypothetical protein
MQADRLDALARAMTTARSRRGTLGIVLSASLGVLGVSAAAAGKKPHRKPKKRKPKKAAPKQLGQACTPGRDTCSGGLKCDTPTTRHTCSSSIPRGPWCCVPPGGACSECSCCGDFYCEFDNNNQPHCVPNPEG